MDSFWAGSSRPFSLRIIPPLPATAPQPAAVPHRPHVRAERLPAAWRQPGGAATETRGVGQREKGRRGGDYYQEEEEEEEEEEATATTHTSSSPRRATTGKLGHAYGNGAVPSYMRMSYQQNGADSYLSQQTVAAGSRCSCRRSNRQPTTVPPRGRYGDYRQAGEAFNQLECAIVGPLAAEEQGGGERRRAADGFPRAAYINEPSAASSRSGAADEQTRMLC